MHKNRNLKTPVKKYAKIVFMVVVAFFVAWIATSYTKSEIADRAIVLGLGIDVEQSNFVVTAEVISPNEGNACNPKQNRIAGFAFYAKHIGKCHC